MIKDPGRKTFILHEGPSAGRTGRRKATIKKNFFERDTALGCPTNEESIEVHISPNRQLFSKKRPRLEGSRKLTSRKGRAAGRRRERDRCRGDLPRVRRGKGEDWKKATDSLGIKEACRKKSRKESRKGFAREGPEGGFASANTESRGVKARLGGRGEKGARRVKNCGKIHEKKRARGVFGKAEERRRGNLVPGGLALIEKTCRSREEGATENRKKKTKKKRWGGG